MDGVPLVTLQPLMTWEYNMKVRDLIKLLKKADPDMDIEMTMNHEYASPIGAIYFRDNTLVIDDVPCEVDFRLGSPPNLLYTEW
jgi:hypothetical protein